MVKIGRRCVIWFLCSLILVTLATGGSSCKEEERESPASDVVEQETAPPEAQQPAEGETGQKTSDFEEEEGVEQEDEPHYDY